MNIAIITAAGTGQRMGQDIPKQFITVNDKPIIIYTLEVFQKHPNIDEIYVTCLENWNETLKAYCKQFNITKLKSIVPGGDTGFLSIRNAVSEIKKSHKTSDIIIIHDGNRAMVSSDIISNNLATCQKYGNAITHIPTAEVIMVSENNRLSSNKALDRAKVVRTQTPHSFKLKDVLDAFEKADKQGIKDAAALCGLFADLGLMVYFSLGSEKNLKLTTVEDIEIFKALLVSKGNGWLK